MFAKFKSKLQDSLCETENKVSGNVEMEKLIPIVNQLHDVCKQMGTTAQFDLPQIAVIGCQSAGKSSVLENIVGRDFLPRGNGIVTRRPLILQLINNEDAEYGELFEGDPGEWKEYDDFNDIREAIVAETDRVTGSNKGISKEPISLRIYSPNVLDLTLIDLPGMTKVPVGDQPQDIGQQIREMILEFIRKPNCLILAVSPANVDLANSDALELAKKVDEGSQRTIGVITKLDLMDKGTDARDIFEGRLYPLHRGYIGVVNRSQMDIDDCKDIEATLTAEREFFISHSYYQMIADRLGTPYLQKVLNKQLSQHIRQTLSSLQEKTRKELKSLEKQIANYEELHPEDVSTMKEVMINVIQRLQEDFKKEMGSLGSDDVHTDRLSHGAQIRRIFYESLPEEITKIQYDEDEVRQQISNAIDNLYGYNSVLNIPFKAFETLAKKQIEDLEAPIKKCVGLVVKELKNAVQSCTGRISSYPKFRDHVENDIMEFIQNTVDTNMNNILSLVQMESTYMNAQHYEFKTNKPDGLVAVLIEQIASMSKRLTNDQKKDLAGELTGSIESYINPETKRKSSDDDDSDSDDDDDGVICEGNLVLENALVKTEYWFVLKSKSLSCCALENHGMIHFTLQLKGLKFRLMKESGDLNSNNQKIILFKPNGENVHNGTAPHKYKELKLSSKKSSEIRSWRKSLSLMIESDVSNRLDPLEKDVDDGYEKISSYMRIVKKTLCDMVPKAVTLFIIRELEKFIKTSLLVRLPGPSNDETMKWFGADEDETVKYNDWKKMRETCKMALEIMEKSNLDI